MKRFISKWGRYVGPVFSVLVLTLVFVMSPIRGLTQQWVSGFLRDAAGAIYVNVIGGTVSCSNCGGATIQGWQVTNIPPSTSCVSPSVCVIKAAAGTVHSIVSLTVSGQSQPNGECDVYNNAAAASGPIIYAESGAGAGQIMTVDAYATNGIVVQCAATPGGHGLNVEWN